MCVCLPHALLAPSQFTRSWAGALTLACIAATFGALTQLQFKALSSAIMEGLEDIFDAGRTPRPMYRNAGELVLQLLTVASSAIAQVGFLNYAISVAPVAYSVPAYQAGLLIVTLLLSGWVLDEYNELTMVANLMFWLGAGIVGALSQCPARRRSTPVHQAQPEA